jgi:hypothetical protein
MPNRHGCVLFKNKILNHKNKPSSARLSHDHMLLLRVSPPTEWTKQITQSFQTMTTDSPKKSP